MKQTLIIAEAGVNHNGDLELAKRLVDVAAEAGADYVKFQTFRAEKLATKHARKAAYQEVNTKSDDSQFNMLKKLELPESHHYELQEYCRKKGIGFLSTAFDIESIQFLKDIGIKIGKVPSGEITNLPYLEQMAKAFPQVILSTGMSSLEEVEAAVKILLENGTAKDALAVLHCNTEYPTPMEDVNLKAMLQLKERLGVRVGYSDHTEGIEVPVAAVALGATIIEKHFTLDRTMEGPDHLASLEPEALIDMVKAIRNIEKAVMGSGIKVPSESEQKNTVIARKSIVAARAIKKGEVLGADNLTTKRPGNGISPMRWYEVCGTVAKQDYDQDDMIAL